MPANANNSNMKLRTIITTSYRRRRLRYNSFMATVAITVLLSLSKIIITRQYSSQSALDEEISLDDATTQHHHHFSPPETLTAGGAIDVEQNDEPQSSSSPQLPVQSIHYLANNDPFAATFDDYIRDTKSNGFLTQHAADKQQPSTAIHDTLGLIIEDDEQTGKESPIIDYVQSQHSTNTPNETTQTTTSHKHQHMIGVSNKHQINDSHVQLNEIKLLFGWKSSLTNKCSKSCGKGFKILNLSCIDLKYAVRVEEELCLNAKLPRPQNISEETCNEIDCSPEWSSIEFQECNNQATQDGVCHPSLYKKVQCTQINKHGQLVHLEESRCNSLTSNTNKVVSNESNQSVDNIGINEDSIYINTVGAADEFIQPEEKDDMISNSNNIEPVQVESHQSTGNHPHNEPFFETGPWSECSGECGELGRRTRNVSCRLYLSRSSRFADLPAASCHHSTPPDRQEPCYMDCARTNSDLDETVYDQEMTRFIWIKNGYTKCSSECLGGKRETIIECWDKISESPVDFSLCDTDTKPQPSIESCNDVPCTPEWRIETFSSCSRPCGSAGIRTRSIACVQQIAMEGGSSFMVVSNDLCFQTNGTMPHKTEPCNRFDCKPEWQVGPWTECSNRCGVGYRNRTVICVQEFAHRDGPRRDSTHRHHHKDPSPELLEAIAMAANEWRAGESIQVPVHECFEEYKSIPTLDERCSTSCEQESYIDADRNQEYNINHKIFAKKRTINLKIGGSAHLHEGRNLKLRCKIMHKGENLVRAKWSPVEWRKDGVLIFSNQTTRADKQYVNEDIRNEILLDDSNQFMADQPNTKRSVGHHTTSTRRNLVLRSPGNQIGFEPSSKMNFSFVPSVGGRFSLVKDNILRIKRLRHDDSGIYTCSHGNMSESLSLMVSGRGDAGYLAS